MHPVDVGLVQWRESDRLLFVPGGVSQFSQVHVADIGPRLLTELPQHGDLVSVAGGIELADNFLAVALVGAAVRVGPLRPRVVRRRARRARDTAARLVLHQASCALLNLDDPTAERLRSGLVPLTEPLASEEAHVPLVHAESVHDVEIGKVVTRALRQLHLPRRVVLRQVCGDCVRRRLNG